VLSTPSAAPDCCMLFLEYFLRFFTYHFRDFTEKSRELDHLSFFFVYVITYEVIFGSAGVFVTVGHPAGNLFFQLLELRFLR
jgi:hypothetical protein